MSNLNCLEEHNIYANIDKTIDADKQHIFSINTETGISSICVIERSFASYLLTDVICDALLADELLSMMKKTLGCAGKLAFGGFTLQGHQKKRVAKLLREYVFSFGQAKEQKVEQDRFLLIIEGDGQSFFSAPRSCASVAIVKEEIRTALTQKLQSIPDAGISILAHCLRLHLLGCKSLGTFDARKWYSVVKFGKEPAIGQNDNDFNYIIDMKSIISEEELPLWRQESEDSFLFFSLNNQLQLYEVVQLRCCHYK